MRGFKFLALVGLTTVSLLASPSAKAGFLLEPYIGYELGKLETNGANYDLSTAALGARVGFTFPVIFIAADYMLPMGGSLKQDNTAATKWDASGSQLFAVVGANFPLLRAYAGYGLLTTLEAKSGNVTNKWEGGTAFKVGIGASVFPMVSANLEYINSTYEKENGVTVSGRKSNFYMLSLSVPFDLM